MATIKPLALIIDEIAGDQATVDHLLDPAVSEHTYDPKPSDARKAGTATRLFYVGGGLDDWATRLGMKNRIEVFPLVPKGFRLANSEAGGSHEGHDHEGHDHGDEDPHFWSDPLAVKALVPPLIKALTEADPSGAAAYQANGEGFMAELDALHAELTTELKPVEGRPVVLFHPSFCYLLQRYGLVYAGVVEESPGKEASPRELNDLVEKLRSQGVRAIFAEPQMNPRAAEVIAQEAGIKMAVLDPLGALDGTETYADLLRINAKALRQALE